ncbi:MAG: hypothetical protein AAGA48_25480 [Myxococcota bacterium]
MVLLLTTLAHAGPAGALGVDAGVSTADRTLALNGRLRFEKGWQLGFRGFGAQVTEGFVDGFAVDGTRLGGTVELTVPLVRLETVQVDIEVDAGIQQLQPEADSRIDDNGVSVIADLSPMVTLPLGGTGALRVGWKNVFHQQVAPSSALDAQGALIRAEGVLALNEDLQLAIGGATGGIFGFNGDGGKYLAGAHAAFRWVPGMARTWKNF